MNNITIEEVKEMIKRSIDATDTMNQALENLIQSIYLKGYGDAILEIEKLPLITQQMKDEDIAKAFQIGMALGFSEKHDCRDYKKYEDCPCGKNGHESGTSQGYSTGECKDFEPQKNEE